MKVIRDLQRISADDVRALAESREAIVAVGEGELSGSGAEALLLADFAVMLPGSVIHTARVHAGLVWRLGHRALGCVGRTFTAEEALRIGLIDATTWSFEKSELAFDAGAQLIGRRGGDTLERAEFARLFATGEPQEGLAAFLEKRRPEFKGAHTLLGRRP